jgi:predicted membrane protein
MKLDTLYHPSAAIIIIILNALSFLTLGFVLAIYIIRWSKISSFPLRLVIHFNNNSHFIFVLHAYYKIYMFLCTILFLLMIYKIIKTKYQHHFVYFKLLLKYHLICPQLYGQL